MVAINDTREKLILAAYDVVSRVGLEGFSMQQVTTSAGVSKRLVYKYFGTKENFLFECYVHVDRQIAAAFDSIVEKVTSDNPLASETMAQVWFPYFKFMVGLGNQALFYYAYRDSANIYEVIENDAASAADYFKGFFDYIAQADVAGTSFENMDEDVLWTYIIDCTGMFAKRVIRGEIPFEDEYVQQIWQLISTGLLQA